MNFLKKPSRQELELTQHALDQFTKRFSRLERTKPSNPKKTIWKFYGTAVEEHLPEARRLQRLLNNKCQEARYFRSSSGWRFVISNNKIVTIEHVKHEKN